MAKHTDFTGKKFTRLTVISFSHINKNRNACWNCLCDCNGNKIVISGELTNGHVKSCGCIAKEIIIKRNILNAKHNMRWEPIYNSWHGMLQRCYNFKNVGYKYYGKRGIKVCKRWKNSFINFYKDMGDRPENLTLDRIDNNGNYTPKNCRWSTRIEQANNTRNNVLVTIGKKTKTVSEWARIKKINNSTVFKRINRYGWSPEKAILTPV